MTAKAIGVIEAIGLAAAIEAADAAAKAANVVVLGYENARGGGRITVKLVGDVGAVRAAVSAGSAAAMRVGKVAGCLVIPRPHDEIASLIAKVDRGRPRGPLAPPPGPDGAGAQPDIAVAEPDDAALAPAAGPIDPPAAGDAPVVEAGPPPADDAPVVEAGPPPAGDAPATTDAGPAGAAPVAPGEPAAADAEAAERRKPAALKRGRAPKSGPRPTPDSGEVEG